MLLSTGSGTHTFNLLRAGQTAVATERVGRLVVALVHAVTCHGAARLVAVHFRERARVRWNHKHHVCVCAIIEILLIHV